MHEKWIKQNLQDRLNSFGWSDRCAHADGNARFHAAGSVA
jgi:hypothetical protein